MFGLDCIIPKNCNISQEFLILIFLVDYAEPHIFIRCHNKSQHQINNISINALDLNFVVDVDSEVQLEIDNSCINFKNPLLAQTFTDIKYAIQKFNSGFHKVKVTASFSINNDQERILTFWLNVDIPAQWKIKNFNLPHSLSKQDIVKITPEFTSKPTTEAIIIHKIYQSRYDEPSESKNNYFVRKVLIFSLNLLGNRKEC